MFGFLKKKKEKDFFSQENFNNKQKVSSNKDIVNDDINHTEKKEKVEKMKTTYTLSKEDIEEAIKDYLKDRVDYNDEEVEMVYELDTNNKHVLSVAVTHEVD